MLEEKQKKEILEQISKTINFINRKSKSYFYPEYNGNSLIYTFTTENISDYSKKINMKNKDILTVTGSADHLLNFVYNDALNIDCFDVNKNAYYFSELKIGAIKSLSYDEFLNYFASSEDSDIVYSSFTRNINNNDLMFNKEIYDKISKYLSADVKYYWDNIYSIFENEEINIGKSLCMSMDKKSAIRNNNYLNSEESYNKLKTKINNIKVNYFTTDVLDLYKIQKKYDYIFLSNIYTYLVDEYYSKISEEDFNNYIKNDLSNLLKNTGSIAVFYQYHYREKEVKYTKSLQDLFKSKYVLNKNQVLSDICSTILPIPSVIKEYRNNGEQDCLYMYNNKTR